MFFYFKYIVPGKGFDAANDFVAKGSNGYVVSLLVLTCLTFDFVFCK